MCQVGAAFTLFSMTNPARTVDPVRLHRTGRTVNWVNACLVTAVLVPVVSIGILVVAGDGRVGAVLSVALLVWCVACAVGGVVAYRAARGVATQRRMSRRALIGVVGVLVTALIPLFIAYYLAAALLAHHQ
jgi:urea transporter